MCNPGLACVLDFHLPSVTQHPRQTFSSNTLQPAASGRLMKGTAATVMFAFVSPFQARKGLKQEQVSRHLLYHFWRLVQKSCYLKLPSVLNVTMHSERNTYLRVQPHCHSNPAGDVFLDAFYFALIEVNKTLQVLDERTNFPMLLNQIPHTDKPTIPV